MMILSAKGTVIIPVFFIFLFYSFFLRMIGDMVAAKPYEVNTLTGQTVFL